MTSRSSRFWLFASWGIASLLLFTAARPFIEPVVMPDEVCYLGWSRYLSGGAFYSMGAAGYCNPLYPGLLVLSQAFGDTPAETYRTALALNSLIAGACLPVAAWIGLRHFQLPRAHAWCAAIGAALYPPLAAYAPYAWPEALLYLLTLLWFLAWCRLVEHPTRGRAWTWMAVALVAYFVHPRMLALPMLVVAAGFLWWLRHRSIAARQDAFAAIGATLAAVALMSFVKASATSESQAFATVIPLSHVDLDPSGNLATTLAKFGGQSSFALLVTLGIAWLPTAWLASALHRPPVNRRLLTMVAAAPAVLLAFTALGAMFLSSVERFDTYFYGRYAGPAILLNILVGLALLDRDHRQVAWTRWLFLLAAACLMLLYLAPPWAASVPPDYSPIHVNGVRWLFDSLQAHVQESRHQWGLVGLIVLMALAGSLLARAGWHWAALSLFVFFLGLHGTGESRRGTGVSKHLPQGELAGLLSRDDCTIFWSPDIRNRQQNHQAYRLQYAYPACRLTFISGNNCEPLPAGALLVVDSVRRPSCLGGIARSYTLEPGLEVQVIGRMR